MKTSWLLDPKMLERVLTSTDKWFWTMLYCFVRFQTLPSPFGHYCPISNTFGVQTPPSHFGHQHATLDTNVQSWTFSSKSTNVWIKEWSPCYVCREYFLIARFYRMLHHLSTFIQAVCTRSLTSFALFTATLKHSCSLSSTRGDPPWRKKQQCYEEFSPNHHHFNDWNCYWT